MLCCRPRTSISDRLRRSLSLVFVTAGLLGLGAAQAASNLDSMAERTRACTACHGEQGRAGPDGYYPRLAGKPAGYLYHQLLNFRAGRRHYPLMEGLIAPLSDAYLREIAQYFSSLAVPYPAPVLQNQTPRERERARILVTKGDTTRNIPACKQCHGDTLMGVNPATPALLGLPADYINAQLGGWRSGQRHAMSPDCMARVATRLSEGDVNLIARWLSSQPVPVGGKPAPQAPAPAPGDITLECGSAP